MDWRLLIVVAFPHYRVYRQCFRKRIRLFFKRQVLSGQRVFHEQIHGMTEVQLYRSVPCTEDPQDKGRSLLAFAKSGNCGTLILSVMDGLSALAVGVTLFP